MAHFIGYLTGRSKTTASRLGTKSTGISARAQGWNIGGEVRIAHTLIGDVVEFTLTRGSNGSRQDEQLVARFVLDGSEVKREV